MNAIEDVSRLARLARITVPEKELPVVAKEFEGIRSYISQLNEITLSDTKEDRDVPILRNVLRTDADETPRRTWTDILVNLFPSRSKNLLTVKKIISHD